MEGIFRRLAAVERFPRLYPFWNGGDFRTVAGAGPVGDLGQFRGQDFDSAGGRLEGNAVTDLRAESHVGFRQDELVDATLLEGFPVNAGILVRHHFAVPPFGQIGLIHLVVVGEVVPGGPGIVALAKAQRWAGDNSHQGNRVGDPNRGLRAASGAEDFSSTAREYDMEASLGDGLSDQLADNTCDLCFAQRHTHLVE